MTLVARFLHGTIPVMVADLLISAPRQPRQIETMPFVPLHLYTPPNPGRVPHELRQKISVMGSHRMVVGWSGPVRIAQDIVGEIYDNCQREVPTIDQLLEFLKAIPSSVWHEFGLLGVLMHDTFTEGSLFESPGYLSHQSKWLGKIDVIGSGAIHVKDFLPDERPPQYSELNPEDPFLCAAQVGLNIVSSLCDTEFRTASTLDNWYGGAYEIAAWYSPTRGFCRTTRFLYSLWHVKGNTFQDAQVAVAPLCSCLYEYDNDLLILRSFCNEPDGSIVFDHTHLVPPVWRDVESKERNEIEPPALNKCIFIVINVLFSIGGSENYHTSFFVFPEEDENLDDTAFILRHFPNIREKIAKQCRDSKDADFYRTGI